MYLECVKYRDWSELPDHGYVIVGQIRSVIFPDRSVNPVGNVFLIHEIENGTDQYVQTKPSYISRADAKNDLHLCVKYNRDRFHVNMFFWVTNVNRLNWTRKYGSFISIEDWHENMYKVSTIC